MIFIISCDTVRTVSAGSLCQLLPHPIFFSIARKFDYSCVCVFSSFITLVRMGVLMLPVHLHVYMISSTLRIYNEGL